MAHNVIKIARTRFGQVRIGIPINRWQDANDSTSARRDASRDFICIKVKKRLNREGAQVRWLVWNDIKFFDIHQPVEAVPTASEQFRTQVQHALDWAISQEEVEEARTLFPDFFGEQPAQANFDVGCRCVPSRVTAR